MLRAQRSPTRADGVLVPYTGWPSYVSRPKNPCLLRPYVQWRYASTTGTAPLQCDTCTSFSRCEAVQGAKPRIGSLRCQICNAQYVPSGALQAATRSGRVGPSYAPQAFL